MIKYALIAAAAVFAVGCNSSPSQSPENKVGGPNVVASAQAPMATATTSLSLDWGKKGQAGQVAIAQLLSYGGSKPAIAAPAGWLMIRDDSTPTTRQSLYWHAIQANDAGTATWAFSAPVDAQGAIVLLDNVASAAPVDMTSGNTGTGGMLTARSIATTADGDLILSYYATDFHLPGLLGSSPQMPAETKTLMNQEAASREFWILATYQSQNGVTEDQVCSAAQLFNWAAAQVAIKPANATPSPP
ncbi:hypothetical protein [Candidatus Binatus sp.]|uniref:hypothetical protein n=1 Tax=Candidatus Binatus sp. TaxID=2811406 RepID=UPI002F91F4B2